jgi:hypothetical protein
VLDPSRCLRDGGDVALDALGLLVLDRGSLDGSKLGLPLEAVAHQLRRGLSRLVKLRLGNLLGQSPQKPLGVLVPGANEPLCELDCRPRPRLEGHERRCRLDRIEVARGGDLIGNAQLGDAHRIRRVVEASTPTMVRRGSDGKVPR